MEAQSVQEIEMEVPSFQATLQGKKVQKIHALELAKARKILMEKQEQARKIHKENVKAEIEKRKREREEEKRMQEEKKTKEETLKLNNETKNLSKDLKKICKNLKKVSKDLKKEALFTLCEAIVAPIASPISQGGESSAPKEQNGPLVNTDSISEEFVTVCERNMDSVSEEFVTVFVGNMGSVSEEFVVCEGNIDSVSVNTDSTYLISEGSAVQTDCKGNEVRNVGAIKRVRKDVKAKKEKGKKEKEEEKKEKNKLSKDLKYVPSVSTTLLHEVRVLDFCEYYANNFLLTMQDEESQARNITSNEFDDYSEIDELLDNFDASNLNEESANFDDDFGFFCRADCCHTHYLWD